jgi:hypothetical protein
MHTSKRVLHRQSVFLEQQQSAADLLSRVKFKTKG